MPEVALRVGGMSCGHCERAVTQAIRQRDPAAEVTVDLEGGTVRAETTLPPAEVVAAIEGEGYKVASVED